MAAMVAARSPKVEVELVVRQEYIPVLKAVATVF
jgi:hypothetical protein